MTNPTPTDRKAVERLASALEETETVHDAMNRAFMSLECTTAAATLRALLAERDHAEAEAQAMRALLRTGCDLLANEAEVLRISVTTSDGLSADPEDAQNVAALNEIEDYIASVKDALFPERTAQSEGGDNDAPIK